MRCPKPQTPPLTRPLHTVLVGGGESRQPRLLVTTRDTHLVSRPKHREYDAGSPISPAHSHALRTCLPNLPFLPVCIFLPGLPFCARVRTCYVPPRLIGSAAEYKRRTSGIVPHRSPSQTWDMLCAAVCRGRVCGSPGSIYAHVTVSTSRAHCLCI